MGYSSFECKGCHRSLLAPDAVPADLALDWLTEAVTVQPDGTTFRGCYTGFATVEGQGPPMGTVEFYQWWDSDTAGHVERAMTSSWWHQACYDLSGQPGYTGPSANAADQGFFFEPAEYDDAAPEAAR